MINLNDNEEKLNMIKDDANNDYKRFGEDFHS